MQDKIAVIGGGSWGTALASLVSNNNFYTTIYALEEEVVESINSNNKNILFLPECELNENLKAKTFSDIEVDFPNYIVWAVPTQFSRQTAKKYKKYLDGKNIVIATKGIEISTGELIIEIMEEVLDADFSILSGPSFAKEVAEKKPTAVSIASKVCESAKDWQRIFSNNYFRAYTTDDVIGVEVGGAMKNVIAIATGIADGLGFGHNARAGLITRGLTEITRLGIKLGGSHETFMGLSGMGDLVLTCTGELSRNRQFGLKIAKGLSSKEILSDMKMVAEGVFTAKAAYELTKKLNIEMPISTEVYKVIYEDKNPLKSVVDLMERPLKTEKVK
jgi:glycerol-3-phosphate dehydrogenase (NAD(P)+)